MEKRFNDHVKHLPKHLLQYTIDQDYSHYTFQDQAVWRYVMRQNISYLPSVCHGSYIDGLTKTGLSSENIPSMYGMTRILKNIGWYAVAVDGFIPPTVFMEFQAHNVLVIAADIRQVSHIGYTPAPDILHEAAGHAPIIANKSYSDYLKKFGKIGSKAFSSAHDMELFDAIRELSILKEAPQSTDKDIKNAEEKVQQLQSKANKLSEMAMIRNLHWWTVEYGLIGNVENPKIYGAGLLSSISESVNCLNKSVKKIKYDINAANFNFDITKEQPQLFVARNFNHLNDVLEEFSQSMAFIKGGKDSLLLAIESKSISTCELESGIQISGVFHDFIERDSKICYVRTSGPTALSLNNKQIKNHGISNHSEGFGFPLGKITNITITDSLKTKIGEDISLVYDSGISVTGTLINSLLDKEGKIIILTFSGCTVYDNIHNEKLFDPSWGVFDLVIGQEIKSSYPNAADRSSFPGDLVEFSSKTIKPKYNDEDLRLHQLYGVVRQVRENKKTLSKLKGVLDELMNYYRDEWLIFLEICEMTEKKSKFHQTALIHLLSLKEKNPMLIKLIDDGLKLVL